MYKSRWFQNTRKAQDVSAWVLPSVFALDRYIDHDSFHDCRFLTSSYSQWLLQLVGSRSPDLTPASPQDKHKPFLTPSEDQVHALRASHSMPQPYGSPQHPYSRPQGSTPNPTSPPSSSAFQGMLSLSMPSLTPWKCPNAQCNRISVTMIKAASCQHLSPHQGYSRRSWATPSPQESPRLLLMLQVSAACTSRPAWGPCGLLDLEVPHQHRELTCTIAQTLLLLWASSSSTLWRSLLLCT